MKEWFNLKTLFPRDDEKHFEGYSYIGDRIILSLFTIFIGIAGLVGNGNVIWLLGFRIKRKPFAIYILNLAVADFGFLLFLFPLHICMNTPSFDGDLDAPFIVLAILTVLCLVMYCSCHLLLTTISTDRCVSVLFPNWYQCHSSSPVLSTFVCAFIWAFSFVLCGWPLIVSTDDFFSSYFIAMVVYVVTVLICHLIVTLLTLILLIKVCFQSRRCQCANLSKVILLMLLSFLLLPILTFVCAVMNPSIPEAYCGLGIFLKSSVNPLIYFLAGRQNGGQCGERMKVILQRVFKEARDSGMELQLRIPTVL